MRKLFSVLVATSMLCGMIGGPPAFGRTKKGSPPPRLGTLISSVTPTSITVSEGGTTKTFAITQFTDIIVNGQKAKVADLRPGMLVSIGLGTDRSQASRITAQNAPTR